MSVLYRGSAVPKVKGPVVAKRVGRSNAVLFMTAALEGMSVQQHAPAPLYPRERPGTHCTGGWVGSRSGLDGRKTSPHRDSISRPSSS